MIPKSEYRFSERIMLEQWRRRFDGQGNERRILASAGLIAAKE
jgi:hypothetical protein